MVASDNAGKVSHTVGMTAHLPLGPTPLTDDQPGKLSIGPGGAKDNGGTLAPVAKQADSNTASTAPTKINFQKIDDALRGKTDLYLTIVQEIKVASSVSKPNLANFQQEMKRIEETANQILDSYQRQKNNGGINEDQFKKTHDAVYDVLENLAKDYFYSLENTYSI